MESHKAVSRWNSERDSRDSGCGLCPHDTANYRVAGTQALRRGGEAG
jgi:hypothetical protein